MTSIEPKDCTPPSIFIHFWLQRFLGRKLLAMDVNGHFDINQTLLCLFKLKCQAAHGILFCVAHNALNWDLFLDVVVVNVWFYSCSHAIKRERWQMVMMLKLLIILCHVSFHFLGFSLKLWSFNFPLAEHSVLIVCLFSLFFFLLAFITHIPCNKVRVE